MADNQHTAPNGLIVTRGDPICKYERVLSAAAKPGMLVVYDSNDYTCKKSDGSGSPYGWLGYERSPLETRPDTLDTEYASGDVASIVAGGSFEIYALTTGSTTAEVVIYPGTPMADNGDGTLKIASGASVEQSESSPYTVTLTQADRIVAIAQEYKSIPANSTAAGVVRLHVLSLI